MSDLRSDVALNGSHGPTSQSQPRESAALQNERLRMYMNDSTFSVSARISGVGPLRSKSDRDREHGSVCASVDSLGNQKVRGYQHLNFVEVVVGHDDGHGSRIASSHINNPA
ncbi:hypothetical protein GQX73_g5770 [Xylaria multiplex]|uniref:Uncharacterized protein n=1 Tax=Xylaria multiplex TaxID=323545 RepID=A0A7C8MSP9_9PEZI|nr:hypothetical protein GQX73_g5770 [Xylaria multiplex]